MQVSRRATCWLANTSRCLCLAGTGTRAPPPSPGRPAAKQRGCKRPSGRACQWAKPRPGPTTRSHHLANLIGQARQGLGSRAFILAARVYLWRLSWRRPVSPARGRSSAGPALTLGRISGLFVRSRVSANEPLPGRLGARAPTRLRRSRYADRADRTSGARERSRGATVVGGQGASALARPGRHPRWPGAMCRPTFAVLAGWPRERGPDSIGKPGGHEETNTFN